MGLLNLSFLFLTLLLLSLTESVHNPTPRSIRTLHHRPPWPPRNLPNLRRMRKPSASRPPTCPTLLPTSRIVGGVESSTLAPYLAGLFLAYGKAHLFLQCTGIMISPRWLVTAAHCQILSGAAYVAVLGSDKASSGHRIRIERTDSPEQFGPKHFPFDRDIAFVKLAKPAPKNIKFAPVNTFEDLPHAGAGARVVGYGITEYKKPGEAEFDEILRQVDLPVMSQEYCRQQFELATPPVNVSQSMLCAGVPGCGPCEADSGGPLLQFDRQGRPVLIGIVSASVRCAENFPTIFTRVSSFVPFMKKMGVKFTRAKPAEQLGTSSASPEPTSSSASESTIPSTMPKESPTPSQSPTPTSSPGPAQTPTPKPPLPEGGSVEIAGGEAGAVEGAGGGNKALYALAGIGGAVVVAILLAGVYLWRRRYRNEIWESFPSLHS